MLKLYLILLLFGNMYNYVENFEKTDKKKVYYKHTESTAAVESEPMSKDVVFHAIDEVPLSKPESIKLNSAKINSIHETKKKDSKIKPRKGVLNKLNYEVEKSNITISNSSLEVPRLNKVNASYDILQSDKEMVTNSSSTLQKDEKLNTTHVAPIKEVVQELQVAPVTVKVKAARKPKPKPEVTVGEKEADEPIPALPTIKSPFGMPRKIDYIVPIIITLTALPLLGAAFYALYKRGRDYWDKRHYRRMDFLIDGMYNE